MDWCTGRRNLGKLEALDEVDDQVIVSLVLS